MRGKMPVKDNNKAYMKRPACVILSIITVFIFTACAKTPGRYSITFTDVFDTVTDFIAYCGSEDEFNKAAEALHGELLRLHRLYDIYNEYDGIPNLAYINRTASAAPVAIAEEITSILQAGKDFCRDTGGRLNVFAGAVFSVWHGYREAGTGIPSDNELEEAAAHVSPELVNISGGAVSFTDGNLKIDVGALAKGEASRRAALLLGKIGIKDYMLNIGGNVTVSGRKPDGLWKVGVQDPDGEGLFTKVSVSDTSVVTSGDYQRFYEYNGRKYHHIIDLQTLYPADGYRSVTVICGNQQAADALSTALFLMSVEEGTELLKRYGAEALWIKADGQAVRSEGFSRYE